MFSPLLRGDILRPFPSVFHLLTALCAGTMRVLVLICAFLPYSFTFYPFRVGLSSEKEELQAELEQILKERNGAVNAPPRSIYLISYSRPN